MIEWRIEEGMRAEERRMKCAGEESRVIGFWCRKVTNGRGNRGRMATALKVGRLARPGREEAN